MKVTCKVLVSDIKCPCGGECNIVEFPNEDRGVTHTIPYCKEFEVNDPAEFLHYLNQSKLN